MLYGCKYFQAFPKGSPLAAYFSKAILDVTQGSNMTAIEQKNFGPGYSSQDPLSSRISQETSSLTLYDFAGLFLIIGSVTVFALFCSETPVGRKLAEKTGKFIYFCFHFKTSRLTPIEDASVSGDSLEAVPNNLNFDSSGERSDGDVIEEDPQHGNEGIQETCISGDTPAAQN